MKIGVPTETCPGERRVALVPAAITPLTKAGFEILIEASAGTAAGFSDATYEDKNARIVSSRAEVFSAADVIVQVRTPGANPGLGHADVSMFRCGHIVVGFAEPFDSHQITKDLAARGVTMFAMELMPRITRAQNMDALSSMATIAGYKSVLLAANALPRMFPMLMTAAGTIAPARVFVVGAGVAGLQAIATARRLGATVEAYDIRPAVKEQVRSLGARFVELGLETEDGEDRSGYAKALDESVYSRQREMMTRVVSASNVVITTAAVPGRRAPILITADMVSGMAPGSVIVDVAAERGGNCELTRMNEVVVASGVTIIGLTNLAASVPHHASQLYAKNVSAFLLHVSKTGAPKVDLEDEITREILVTHLGEVVHPRVRQVLGLEPPAAEQTRTNTAGAS